MSNILEKEKQKYGTYINTLVLQHFSVVLLIDIVEDPDDCYYRLVSSKKWGEISIIDSSVLIPIIPLKGVLPDEQYKDLVRIWNLNHENKAE